MKVTIHQPSYLPWIPFLEKGLQSDVFVLLDTVQYEKNDTINRNRIKSAAGDLWLTVPVSHAHDTPISEVRIAGEHWKRKHRRAIEENYRRAPHFKAVAPPVFAAIDDAGESLAELNAAVDRLFLDWAGFRGQTILASSLETRGSGSQRVLNLCRALGAEAYLSGIGGRDYLQLDAFAEAGIEVLFQQYDHRPYPQQFASLGFLPHLSALDLFMNVGCGEPAREQILAGSCWLAPEALP